MIRLILYGIIYYIISSICNDSRKGLRLSLNILLDSCHSGKGLEAAYMQWKVMMM